MLHKCPDFDMRTYTTSYMMQGTYRRRSAYVEFQAYAKTLWWP